MAVRIICTGDVHFGRRPTRVHPSLRKQLDANPVVSLSLAAAAAIEHHADVFVLTGDIVDEQNRYFEGRARLAAPIRELVEHGIPVVAIAGNHDYNTLQHLAAEVPQFKLLGANGQWQEEIISRNGTPIVRLLGRSFTQRHQQGDVLAGYPVSQVHIPTVGILHCDIDMPQSVYGPVSLSRLCSTDAQAWLLGHVHIPAILSEKPFVLYPGSVQGLDPGEPGPHGPWLITIADGAVSGERLYVAPLRYERLEFSLAGITDDEMFRQGIRNCLEQWHKSNRATLQATKAVAVRLTCTGRSCYLKRATELAPTLPTEESLRFDQVDYFFEKVVVAGQPEVDIEEISLSSDPAGLLAKRLRVLEIREPRNLYQTMLDDALEKLLPVQNHSYFAQLSTVTAEDGLEINPGSAILSEENIRRLLMESGMLMLDELLKQRGATQ